jgi:hypothetical protein
LDAAGCADALRRLAEDGRVEPRGESGQYAAVRRVDADALKAARHLTLAYFRSVPGPVTISRLAADASIDPILGQQVLAALASEGMLSPSTDESGRKTFTLTREPAGDP